MYKPSSKTGNMDSVINPTSNGKGLVLTFKSSIYTLECLRDGSKYFECLWIDACPSTYSSYSTGPTGCKGVKTIINRQSYISQVVYDRDLYFGLGPIPKANPKSADFSWWLFEIVHIVCFEMHMDRPDKSANIFGI